MYVPTDEQFWSKQDPSKPDIAFLKNHFYREGRLTEEQALFILQKCVVGARAARRFTAADRIDTESAAAAAQL